jgi:prophage antirepressor-like protein
MKFEKRVFMGIELDVLVGHPEHELIFVGQQIARAAGLKDPSESVRHERLKRHAGIQLASLRPLIEQNSFSLPKDSQGRRMRSTSVLFTEAEVYTMLLRGHAPQSEPFRKWVTEEVLPSIRKTGSYNAEESDHPIAQGIMDRLMSLEGIVLKQTESIQALRQELQAKTFSLEAPAPEVSPTVPHSREDKARGPMKEFFFTPIGTVEPHSYISKPDFGRGSFTSERGKYKINLTIQAHEAQGLIGKIVKIYETDYAKRVAEYKKNPPQVLRGRKPLTPYQGDLPFIDNGDGTVTFKFAAWSSYEGEGEPLPRPLRVVDAYGEAIADVPKIGAGSKGKVRFSIVSYGWGPMLGASVKLHLEGFMLTKLAEFADSQGDWIGHEEMGTLA